MQVLEVKPFREALADGSCTYKYEGRLLRIIIQERLCPLTTLTDMKDIAQVLLDNACDAYSLLQHTYAGSVHTWLYGNGLQSLVTDGHRHISCYSLIDPARNLTGKLEGLIVRYESEPASPSTTSTNATQVLPRVGTVSNCPHFALYLFLSI